MPISYPISQPPDNAAPYTYTQPIRDSIAGVNDHQTRVGSLELPPVHAIGNSGTALTLDSSSPLGNVKAITLTANCTFTLTGATAGKKCVLELVLTQDATGGRTVTWPTSVRWASGAAPVLSSQAGSVDRIMLISYDGGTNWYGNPVWSSVGAAAATVPGAPTIGTATVGAAGTGQVTVTFTAPASNGGSSITSYTVTSTPGGITGTGLNSPIVVSGLNAGTAYTFRVKATNNVGTGAESAASNTATPAAAVGGGITFTATAGQGTATTQWSTARTDITGWIIGRDGTDTDGSGLWSTTVAANIMSLTFTKLIPGTLYTFTLTPQTGAGNLTPLTATATPTSPPAPPAAATLVGWSGWDSTNIPGVYDGVFAQWMARSQWSNLALAQWLAFTPLSAYVTGHPNDAIDIGVPLWPFDSGRSYLTELNEAIAGSHDADYTSLGRELANMAPKTVFARVAWEFNMFNPPATQFVQAWQRAIPLIRSGFTAAQPTKTLKIVWCYLTANNNPVPYWPGTNYVDIIGSDIYGIIYGTTNPTVSAMTAHTATCLTELTNFCATYNKPAAIGEWANVTPKANDGSLGSRGCGDCPEYIDQIFDWINTQNATAQKVSHVVYFNDPGGGVGQIINNTPNSLARFQARAALL